MNRKLKLIDKELGIKFGISSIDVGEERIELMIEEGISIDEVVNRIGAEFELIRIDNVPLIPKMIRKTKREKGKDE